MNPLVTAKLNAIIIAMCALGLELDGKVKNEGLKTDDTSSSESNKK